MRLAHCSDLHLLSLDGTGLKDFINKRWIGGLNLISNRGRYHQTPIVEAMFRDFNHQKPDHILVTGDITNLALEQEFRFAKTIFETLELPPEQITVIPGNHDAYVQAGAKYFVEHFEPYFRSDSDCTESSGEFWPCVRRRGPVAIFALSTSLQTPWFTAYGVIGDAQLERLEKALLDPQYDDCLRLVAIHHSPAEPLARSMIRGLRDRKKLYDLLKRTGAELILHGHEHQDLSAILPGKTSSIPVRGIQSGSYNSTTLSRRARYRIYEISDAYIENDFTVEEKIKETHDKNAGKSVDRDTRPKILNEILRVWDPETNEFIVDDISQAQRI